MKVIDIKTGEDITPPPLTREEEFAMDLMYHNSLQQESLLEIIVKLFKKYNL